ncbi:MAG TPA: GNAT family N-acetyltransferase [Tepidisphaeraceae bacterium]|jgi:ribosomal protein S18 acetylase RimI-like enzyme
MKNVSITEGGTELLDRVGPLWNELRDHHAQLAPRWAATLARSFEQRRIELVNKGSGGILVVLAEQDGRDIGYGVSTIVSDGSGEIDSVYVAADWRGSGVGAAIMQKTMEWFASKSVRAITVDVIEGNEAAKKFYEGFGFGLRTMRMRRLD